MSDKPAPVSPTPARVDRLTGKTIANRYVIEHLIARGGMAAVYLAHQVQLNRKVAIKILRPPPDTDESAGFGDRFRLEAETLAQLNHPNIVIIYDHGEFDSDQVFLTMEYVDGLRLTDLIRDGALPVDRALRLLLQVCEALRYAHRRGVIHRDLKPSNLLITRTDDGDEHVKVVDFGLVKLTEVDMSVTSAGLILGSPHCMAPEQVRGLGVDARTDIYAIGVLLFRCLTGKYPFHGANSTATMIAHLNQAVPTFASVAPELAVPDGLEQIVRRCLSKQPSARFASMEELHEAITLMLGTGGEPFRTVSRSQASIVGAAVADPGPARSGLPVGLALGALGALALVSLAICAGVWASVGFGRAIPAVVQQSAPSPVEPTVELAAPPEPAPVEPVEPAPRDPEPPAAAAPADDDGSRATDTARRPDPKPVIKPKAKTDPKPDPEPRPEKVDIGRELAPDMDW